VFLSRALTAAALLAAFVSALWFLERRALAGVAALILAVAGYEWARLDGMRRPLAGAYGAACALLLLGLFPFLSFAAWICGAAAVFWGVAVPWWLARGTASCPEALMPAVGLVVLIPAGLAMVALGREQVLMLLGLVWVADTAAYLVGRRFGKHKLAPVISPGKTWEGVAGGLVATVIYAIIWALFDPGLAARVQGEIWLPYFAAALLLFAASVLGDLLESAAKRRAGAKDSGTLLPGHGGVLDRIDSATATLPVALLLVQMTGAK
jgi:phosphatidate cytidylyltransferase